MLVFFLSLGGCQRVLAEPPGDIVIRRAAH
jgi:hypothetical protein